MRSRHQRARIQRSVSAGGVERDIGHDAAFVEQTCVDSLAAVSVLSLASQIDAALSLAHAHANTAQ